MDILSDLGERLKPQSHFREEAIRHALEGDWEAAVEVNQGMIERFGGDEETWNRLGKALSELGRHKESLVAYRETLKLAPQNPIAEKNRVRLSALLAEQGGPTTANERMDPALFIEEMGKTSTTLLEGSEPATAAKLAPGDLVKLVVTGDSLEARTMREVYLGFVESKLTRRLMKFIRGGNRYEAAVSSVDNGKIRLFIRESHQEPKFAGLPSFPIRKQRAADLRAAARDALLAPEYEITSFDRDEEDEEDTAEPIEELEGMHAVEAEDEQAEFEDDEDDSDAGGDGF